MSTTFSVRGLNSRNYGGEDSRSPSGDMVQGVVRQGF
jgi:hypothetical protein